MDGAELSPSVVVMMGNSVIMESFNITVCPGMSRYLWKNFLRPTVKSGQKTTGKLKDSQNFLQFAMMELSARAACD